MKEKILIIEDDFTIQTQLKTLLSGNGYEVFAVTDFSQTIEQLKEAAPHLVILDIKLPWNNGFEICSQIRTFSDIPIVFVTSSNTDMDELNSIMLGGDAFITKPYNPAILLAKIAALLKKAYRSPQTEIYMWKEATLHLESSMIEYKGQKAELTKNELKILYYLFKNAGKICSRNDIVDFLWDNQLYVDDNALSVNITRIRDKLAAIGLVDFIKTKHRARIYIMSGKQYLKNQLPVILINLLGMLALALFLIASDNPIQTVLFILAVWSIVLVLSLLAFYFSRKKYLNKLLNMTEQLEERYLLPEIMQVPERADEQVFYQIMKMAEKSMLERIGEVQRERREYKEYIEQWIHEVKTPITAMKLLCENNRSPFSREVLAELENINQYTEQALYYARSEHAEKDYSVREVNLCDVVHSAIADNKYLLRQSNMSIQIDDIETKVYTDEKWVRFILNQIIGNAIKYHAEQPILHFGATKMNDKIVLSISDNGIGIPKSDLPRIFEKGFTGQNGRTGKNSTGIGLYLCKRLCDQLGIGLTAYSENRGTTISLIFQMNDFIIGVQG